VTQAADSAAARPRRPHHWVDAVQHCHPPGGPAALRGGAGSPGAAGHRQGAQQLQQLEAGVQQIPCAGCAAAQWAGSAAVPMRWLCSRSCGPGVQQWPLPTGFVQQPPWAGGAAGLMTPRFALQAPVPRDLELDDLKHLPYLTACMKESMRMYPVVSLMGRWAAAGQQLGQQLRQTLGQTLGQQPAVDNPTCRGCCHPSHHPAPRLQHIHACPTMHSPLTTCLPGRPRATGWWTCRRVWGPTWCPLARWWALRCSPSTVSAWPAVARGPSNGQHDRQTCCAALLPGYSSLLASIQRAP
jgi:hypothetical protein